MRKWWMTGVSLILIFALIVGGCSQGGDNESSHDSFPSNSSKSENELKENTESPSIEFPLEQPIKLNIFANVAPQVKKNYNEMQMFKEVQKLTNVEVEWTQVDWENRDEKISILLASSDYPDAFYGRAVLKDQEIVRLGSEGVLIPLEDLIEEYAPNLKKVFEQRPDFKKLITAPDGHIYSLPTVVERDFNEIPSVLFINKKWLDNLDLEIPSTIDEFYNVLKAFKEKDPNQNGQKDEIPLSFLFNNNTYGSNALASSFGIKVDDATHHMYVDDDGQVVYAPAQPGYKDYLQFLHKLNKEQLLDPEVFTHNQNTYLAKVRNEEIPIGAFFGYTLMGIFGNAETDYVPVPPLKGPNGEQGWLRVPLAFSKGAFAITKNNPYPEITLKWLDTMLEEKLSFHLEIGPNGLTVQENPDGTFDKLAPPEGMSPAELKHSEAPGNGATVIVLKEMVDRLNDAQADEKRGYYKMYDPYAPKDLVMPMLWTVEDSEKMAPISLDLNGKNGFYESSFAQFVMNGFTDEDWDNYLDQLNKMGIDEFVDTYQKYYDIYKGN